MNQKKTMKLWQMLAIIILEVGLLVTMFLPAFQYNGKTVKKIGNVVLGVIEDNFSDISDVLGIGESEFDEFKKSFEEGLEEGAKTRDEEIKEEKENGIKISSISPWTIMTTDLLTIVYGDEAKDIDEEELEDNDQYKSASKGYNSLKIIFWIVYMLILVVILLTVLNFCLKWTKFISLSITIVHGLATAIIFGYLRFGLMGSVVDKLGDNASSLLDSFGMGTGILEADKLSSSIVKLFSCLYSVSFIMAFIIGIGIVIVGVMGMILGNDEKTFPPQPPVPPVEPPFPPIPPIPPVPPVPPVPPTPPQPPKPKMGQVKCTQGAFSGQPGFMLPEDRKIVIGKSPKATLVINNQHVSNIHCSVRYNAAHNSYIVKDHSTNGTFVNGARLPKDTAMEYPAGTVLTLADGSNKITLG